MGFETSVMGATTLFGLVETKSLEMQATRRFFEEARRLREDLSKRKDANDHLIPENTVVLSLKMKISDL